MGPVACRPLCHAEQRRGRTVRPRFVRWRRRCVLRGVGHCARLGRAPATSAPGLATGELLVLRYTPAAQGVNCGDAFRQAETDEAIRILVGARHTGRPVVPLVGGGVSAESGLLTTLGLTRYLAAFHLYVRKRV